MSEETTPGLRAQIERILDDAYGHPPSRCLYAITDVVEDALDAKDAEIKRLREMVADYENGINWHTTCLGCARLLDSCYAETMRAEKAETALKAAEDLAGRRRVDHRAELAEAIQQIRAAEAERDQLKAAVDRVRAIHPRESTGFQDVCGSCFDERENSFPWPCPTIAALDPPAPVETEAEFAAIICATMRKHRAEVHPEHVEGCGNCAVIKGAPEVLTYGLDSSDLPAVREFVAGFDPREPDTCICEPGRVATYGCRVHGWAATRGQSGEPT